MIKIRKKILAVLLTAAMLVSMSSLVAWSDEQTTTDDGTSQTEQTTMTAHPLMISRTTRKTIKKMTRKSSEPTRKALRI